MKHLIAFILVIFLFSCQNSTDKKEEMSLTQLSFDTIKPVQTREFIYTDSIIRYSDNRKEKTIIYTNNIAHNSIHYKVLNTKGNLVEIGIAKDTLLYTSPEFKEEFYQRNDYVTRYRDNGTLLQKGFILYEDSLSYRNLKDQYWDVYCTYDSLEILDYRQQPVRPGSNWFYIGTTYHRNGKMKLQWEQGDKFAGGVMLWLKEWDSQGRKIEEVKCEHFMPEWGNSYNHTFTVETTIEYYPNGNIKRIGKSKAFAQSESCPCGEEEYYNKEGKLERTEKHPSCYNYELDCD
ncbi:hypothetical protein [Dysgonomonas sp. 511]|uniref:hypothetical protein n=1 Tax=Dysgonomonas sp. 511 TaxID=2302930 RepID=UPI0013D7AC6E|nr:hypothetical protein [Dysgonomonas sp. 511]NDV79245.1 hypothetical protein [Dysgonomonas sp. 511]